jgi:hypothetical protein
MQQRLTGFFVSAHAFHAVIILTGLPSPVLMCGAQGLPGVHGREVARLVRKHHAGPLQGSKERRGVDVDVTLGTENARFCRAILYLLYSSLPSIQEGLHRVTRGFMKRALEMLRMGMKPVFLRLTEGGRRRRMRRMRTSRRGVRFVTMPTRMGSRVQRALQPARVTFAHMYPSRTRWSRRSSRLCASTGLPTTLPRSRQTDSWAV